MLLIVAFLALLSMVSAVDRIIVHPNSLAHYDYFLKVENHSVSAVLANGTVIHDNADPCTSSTNYQVGKEYREPDCKAPIQFLSNTDRVCNVLKGDGTSHPCQAFCQVRTNYRYDRELPWEKTWCRGAGKTFNCALNSAAYMSYRSDYSLGQMEALYVQGISGGWLSGDGGVFASPGGVVEVKDGECGYWTFISIKKETCGSTSLAIRDQDLGPHQGGCLYDKVWETETVENDCVEQSARGPSGIDYSIGGKNVFVKLDCWDRTPLASGYQDEAYNSAIHLSPSDLQQKLTSWVDFSCDTFGQSNGDSEAIWIEGKGFPTSLIGKDGGTLQSNIKNRCKSMPGGWKFAWDNRGKQTNYEWYANVPVSSTVHGLGTAFQCVLDWFAENGGPRKDQARDCTSH